MRARHLSPAQAARSHLPVEVRAARARCDEFISLASHELLTPVTALQLQTQHIRRLLTRHPEEVPARIPSMVETFDRQLGRLALLCDELLQCTQIVGRDLPLACESVELGPLVCAVVERIAERSDARGLVTIRVVGAPRGNWDRSLLEQLILHLVRNAIVYGEGKPVEIDVLEAEGRARLVVKDRGIGIAEEDHARIFERFERAVPSSQFGGLGLGLYISRAVVEAHGGTIRVESALGQGAAFIIDLPLDALAARRALTAQALGAHVLGLGRAEHRRCRCRRPALRDTAAKRSRNRGS